MADPSTVSKLSLPTEAGRDKTKREEEEAVRGDNIKVRNEDSYLNSTEFGALSLLQVIFLFSNGKKVSAEFQMGQTIEQLKYHLAREFDLPLPTQVIFSSQFPQPNLQNFVSTIGRLCMSETKC